MKHLVVNTFFYKMYIEPHEGLLFFHTDIFKWNKSVMKDFVDNFKELTKEFPLLYAIPEDTDKKMIKFGKLLGFHIIEEVQCSDGVKRKVFMLKENK